MRTWPISEKKTALEVVIVLHLRLACTGAL